LKVAGCSQALEWVLKNTEKKKVLGFSQHFVTMDCTVLINDFAMWKFHVIIL
jgi:hypothetical protein